MRSNTRIGIRITPSEREELEKAIKNGKAETISKLVRKALKQFLEKNP